jgi:cytochrome c-type biogenesis protein CcmH/NrfF
MRRFKVSFLIAVVAAVALAQSASDYDSHEINAIAAHIKCSCGCNQNMSCNMQPGCPVCKAAKIRMYNMRSTGKSEGEILDAFVAESGKDVLVVPPGIMGVVGPYLALAAGLGLVLFTIRCFMHKPAPVLPDADPAVLAQIEKDLAKLD